MQARTMEKPLYLNFRSPAIPMPDTLRIRQAPVHEVYKIDWASNLGEGISGRVRKCASLSSGKQFAMKLLPDNGESRSEIACWLTSMPHPNIVNIVDVFENELNMPDDFFKKKYLVVIMDLMEGGELYAEVVKRRCFCEEDAAFIIAQLAQAISHMHSRGICHRDIKMENILLEKQGSLKVRISDFGFATSAAQAISCKHTPLYAAPEILRSGQFHCITGERGLPYSSLCDEWSLGVCLYVLLCGYPPFVSATMGSDLQLKIMRGRFDFREADWRDISSDAKNVVSRC